MPHTQHDDNSTLIPANWRQWVTVAGLLAVLLAGFNFHWQAATPAGASDQATEPATPDIIVTQALIDEFDRAGSRIRQLHGQRIEHFDGQKRSLVTAPALQLLQQGKQAEAPTPWQMTANTATIFHDSNKIDLQGNVIVWSDATPQGRTELRTELLHVDTDRQFADTDKAVTIHARRSESTAVGLHADLANQRLQLSTRVKEIHEIHH